MGVNGWWLVISNFKLQHVLLSFASCVSWKGMKEGRGEINEWIKQLRLNFVTKFWRGKTSPNNEIAAFLAEVLVLSPQISIGCLEASLFSEHAPIFLPAWSFLGDC